MTRIWTAPNEDFRDGRAGEQETASAGRAAWDLLAQVTVLSGTALAGGRAVGRVEPQEPPVATSGPARAIDVEREVSRLERAAAALEERMQRLVEAGLSSADERRDSALDAFRLFARCREWRDELAAAARSGMPAESAVARTQRQSLARLDGLGDPGLRGWLSEIDHMVGDLLRAFLRADRRRPPARAGDTVLVALRLTAAELLLIEPQVRAVAMEEAPAAGAARLVASTLRVPVVAGVAGIASARRGEQIFVDGQSGTVRLRRRQTRRAAKAHRQCGARTDDQAEGAREATTPGD